MRILIAHNYYQYRGGEEQVFASEANLLEAKGHEVWRYTLDNQHIGEISAIALLGKTLWNQDIYQDLRSLIRKANIQIAHFHNTFPLISPSAYYACQAEGIPVIQTCHNYRLVCPNGMFLRNGQVCEDCLGQMIPISSIQHQCYRSNRAASVGVATMLTTHRLAQTWTRQVDTYIALTEFARQKLIAGGLPASKIIVKPNFVDPDPGDGSGSGDYALFVGRLSTEKGIDLLLAAWQQLDPSIPLKIVGEGPLANEVKTAIASLPNVVWLGQQSSQDVYSLMQNAKFLVFPSRWYEGLPRTLIEALATGTPIIAANLGSMTDLVQHDRTGYLFQSGNVEDLVQTIQSAIAHPEKLTHMRSTARAEFETHYNVEKNYQMLMELYHATLKES